MLLKELAIEDVQEYRNCMRMSRASFDVLLKKISPAIQRSDTTMRMALPARTKLEITLSYLATGNSYRNLQQQFRVSRPAISKFIPEVCDAIYDALEDFIQVPKSNKEWKAIESDFNHRWNFPGCYGAIDGKHILIRAPENCGSNFFNYKGQNSIILMAIVDANYNFIYIDVGYNGRVSDGGVFAQCSIFAALENNILPDGGFLVGDDAFPLKHYLLKPYSKNALTVDEKIFNYRLSRARRIVENGFGILVSRFRVFEKPIACGLSSVDKIVRTCCALHNWLRCTTVNEYLPKGSVDEEDIDQGRIILGSWRSEVAGLPSVSRIGSNHSSQFARNLRDKYKHYFMTTGAVSWQERMIF
ncbi:putative nuclease HARBI1 [Anthonomus grandis grandis]|uniref:putative nuclease HARBI1 n=1 Tax=Anthonomus grandis grandis TaxID=2921223 RepID=UPI002166A993|nr:putative nuclease HARBI1 [Anthonomus grandis grandis]